MALCAACQEQVFYCKRCAPAVMESQPSDFKGPTLLVSLREPFQSDRGLNVFALGLIKCGHLERSGDFNILDFWC